MLDTSEASADTGSTDDAVNATPSNPAANPASGSDGASPALTDDHHDWATAFTGIDTRAGASGDAATASASSDDDSGDGFFSGIANAVSDAAGGIASTAKNVAGDVVNTVSDAASGVVSTVETVASDVGHTVSDVASGVADTAGTVASDIGSGNFGDALGDAASGIVSTTGHLASDVAHTAVDGASGLLSTVGKIVTDTGQAVTDAATGVISTAGKVMSDTAQGVAQTTGPNSMLGKAAGAVGQFSTSAASGLMDTLNTANDFSKGVTEGVVAGVGGLAKGVVSLADSVGKEGFALATDEKAREQASSTILHGAEAVVNFEATVLTDPSKALGQVVDAAGSAVNTVETMASNQYKGYQAAAAQGHGAEFVGKGVGQAAVVVAGAVLTDGASVAGEGAAVAGEGVALLGEGAAVAGESAAVIGEGTTIAGEDAAALGADGVAEGTGESIPGLDTGEPPPSSGPPSEPPSSGGGDEPKPENPEGLAFHKDLPEHLAGPDGWKGGRLNGTHNAQNAMSELEGRGAMKVDTLESDKPGYTVTKTASPGIDTLDYQVINPNTNKLVSASKTTYDPALYTDEQMVEMSQPAGTDAFSRFKLNPSDQPAPFDTQVGDVTMRSYINFDPETNAPYVGNVHPIDPADATFLSGGP